MFHLQSPFKPTGDQPDAIAKLVSRFQQPKQKQTLLGVTGSGKTFTMANVIQQLSLPTLIIAHNKTLAGQLYQEFRDFFPNNAVSYFVSYYDYYQPEAYIPTTDTYIEKEATINDEIDKLRLASTTNLLTRPDCIVVASVSCIYNLGSPVEYGRYVLEIMEGEVIARQTLLLQLDNLQYQRSEFELVRGGYRVRGDTIQIWPAYEDTALQVETLENRITKIERIEPVTGNPIGDASKAYASRDSARENASHGQPTASPRRHIIYPAKHYMTNPQTQGDALAQIEHDLNERLAEMRSAGKIVEAYRLEQKVRYDIDMIRELGFVNGIENYSRYFDGRKPGDPPYTLIEYFHENARIFNTGSFLTIIDESHMTAPQVRAMYNGDRARKQTLIEYGFRLPSALDNRPLQFPEFMNTMQQMLFVSATPGDWEVSMSGNEVVEQLIRPTGLIDPTIELRRTNGQIEDLVIEIIRRKQLGQRALVTTLTKKMAERLTEYLNDPTKIRLLLERRLEKNTLEANSDMSDRVQYQGDELPVDQMEVGPIDAKYLTTAKLPSSLTKLPKELPAELLPKVAYLHSDIITMERADILDDLRRGAYDVVVGINLLREGLDLPEVTLVAMLDADKEGFLRSETSLIQTIGRAARHEAGHVIMYADRLTRSMQAAIGETQRRRQKQWAYNQKHGITPQTIYKPIRERMIAKVEEEVHAEGYASTRPDGLLPNKKGVAVNGKSSRSNPASFQRPLTAQERARQKADQNTPQHGMVITLSKREQIDLRAIDPDALTPADRRSLASKLRRRMKQAANDMDFELAAIIRDSVHQLDNTPQEEE